MADIQLGSHTIKSHGTKVARLHMYDWIILVCLAALDGILNIIEPFHRFVGRDMMTDLRYPLKGNTIPFWAVPNFDNITTDVICHGEKSVIKEGHKSFPSGHSSWSFAGLGFLAWYLAGKLKAFDRKGHIAKLCLVFLPLLIASLVAVSRVDDYWHHWQDVFAGGIIGLTVASFCYLQFFPYPFDNDAIWPHAYFQQLADTHSNGNTNAFGTRPTGFESEDEGHGGIALRDSSPILDSMESGRRP
ncbi:hypothetical protein PR202_ga20733 [Eleusine coracana subsp. coracana]|uniref:Phosphatidic acid phosphatase type 2/haloperoxidase domain-containing protein n=1 Tax=Eleusine coracana subsp. coracana TaxID=191504 RepID=A0AAV5CZ05_ELECO|nr:hypothetical protein PR202_ga20733 [Eleusine coracana subsp. coracana]